MPSPTDKTSLQRLLGFATFLARHCKNVSETTAVLRELLVKDHEFCWSDRHDAAFNHMKVSFCSSAAVFFNCVWHHNQRRRQSIHVGSCAATLAATEQ
jgi:hypothetical protein